MSPSSAFLMNLFLASPPPDNIECPSDGRQQSTKENVIITLAWAISLRVTKKGEMEAFAGD